MYALIRRKIAKCGLHLGSRKRTARWHDVLGQTEFLGRSATTDSKFPCASQRPTTAMILIHRLASTHPHSRLRRRPDTARARHIETPSCIAERMHSSAQPYNPTHDAVSPNTPLPGPVNRLPGKCGSGPQALRLSSCPLLASLRRRSSFLRLDTPPPLPALDITTGR